jgi:hypothetical protein
VMVLVGHCTRNDCALAETVAKATMRIAIQTWDNFLMAVQPPALTGPASSQDSDQACGARVLSDVAVIFFAKLQLQ